MCLMPTLTIKKANIFQLRLTVHMPQQQIAQLALYSGVKLTLTCLYSYALRRNRVSSPFVLPFT